jgi:hypothetical protein
MTKKRTYQQVETAKERAVRFLQNVLDEPDRADEVADESVEDYAARRKFQLVNNPANPTHATQTWDVLEVVDNPPQRKGHPMASTISKAELQSTVNDAADKVSEMLDPELSREDLVRKAKELDSILNGDDDDDDEDEDEEDDDQ